MDSSSTWKTQQIDGGILHFNRATGRNLLVRNETTGANRREAPRAIQIGLLSPCNLSCTFCYRNASAPSRLTAEFLTSLLVEVDQWGVLEVAFGGGEPLLFKGFVQLLRALRDKTSLGLNFTTNGTLLTSDRVSELEGIVGEIRLSAYPDNAYRETLQRAKRLNVGVNYLVTPKNVNRLELDVHDFLRLGARNVLLLGYKGPDQSMHLSADGLQHLKEAVHRMAQLPLRLDICWYPHLAGVDHLFERSDCEAGNEFLVITPDRAVQPCSFHHEKFPFESFQELKDIYHQLQVRRPAATISGCTRSQFHREEANRTVSPGAWTWQARASNNSGDWTIVARFCDTQTAQKAAQSLRELARAHEAFLASDEGQKFVEANGYDGSIPTPRLREFGEAHGFDWKEGLWWEEDGCGAPVLTAGVIDTTVVVYHPYCMGLPEEPFRELFRRTGAVEMGHWQYDRPQVIVRAAEGTQAAINELKDYIGKVAAAEYASEVEEDPPWGSEARDPRLMSDEDRSSRLSGSAQSIEAPKKAWLPFGKKRGDEITLRLGFENTFAGAIAIEQWLASQKFTNIRISIEQEFETLQPAETQYEPKVGLWVAEALSSAPWEQTPLASVSDQQVVEWLFAAGEVTKDFSKRLESVERSVLVKLIEERAATQWAAGEKITSVLVSIGSWLRHDAGPFIRALWQRVATDETEAFKAIEGLHFSLSADEAYERGRDWVVAASTPTDALRRLGALASLREPRLLPLVEELAQKDHLKQASDIDSLATLVTQCRAGYTLLAAWISGANVTLARIGVRALRVYCRTGCPEGFQQTDTDTLTKLLDTYRAHESDDQQLGLVTEILGYPNALVNDCEGI